MNRFEGDIGLRLLIKAFRGRITTTWLIVLIENFLIALIPLFIGLSIDGLLAGRLDELITMIVILVVLGGITVGRRCYDTRVYGTIRSRLGVAVDDRNPAIKVSTRNARLDMSRELVDFLEEEAPKLITALLQIIVSFAVLAYFDLRLGVSSFLVIIAMIVLYSCFHQRFYRFNARLNEQTEQQVEVLAAGSRLGVFRHLRALRRSEVAISDTEAFVYGGIFMLQIAFIAYNLYLGAQLPGITAGKIFSIASYSWEYVEAALMLPMALQSWTRLSEITTRINRDE
ncbi:MAG: ABC transporter six-transmembrane domain-containing protein [Geminicoccaceae bacterium]